MAWEVPRGGGGILGQTCWFYPPKEKIKSQNLWENSGTGIHLFLVFIPLYLKPGFCPRICVADTVSCLSKCTQNFLKVVWLCIHVTVLPSQLEQFEPFWTHVHHSVAVAVVALTLMLYYSKAIPHLEFGCPTCIRIDLSNKINKSRECTTKQLSENSVCILISKAL